MRDWRRTLSELSWRPTVTLWTIATVSVCAFVVGIALAALGQLDYAVLLAFPALLIVALLIAQRQYLALTGLVVAIAIFVDFYEIVGLPLHEPVAAMALATIVIAVIFFGQSVERPWVSLRYLLLWALLLGLAGLAIPRGGSLTQTVTYYVTIFGTSIVMYCLGTQVVRDYRGLYVLLVMVMLISAFIALHSIVQGATGRVLFVTEHETAYLNSSYGFHLAGSAVTRAGSFLLNPDWNGLYLAVSLYIAAGVLFAEATTRAMRIVAAATCLLLLGALLFTFTTASWLAAGVGGALFILAFVPRRYRRWTLVGVVGVGLIVGGVFYRQTRLLLQHATSGSDATSRIGAWETALHIIARYPLTGIGMGYNLYLARSAAYRSPLETVLLAHPHNSYLELAAFAGLPVLLAFLAILGLLFREAVRAYRLTPTRYQPLVGGVIAALVVLSVNSFFINGWTLPPFASLGWLLIGAITSRALLVARASQPQEMMAAPGAQRPASAVVPASKVAALGSGRGRRWRQ